MCAVLSLSRVLIRQLAIRSQIVPRIAGPVLTVTIIATIVAYVSSQGKSVTLTNSVTPLLAVVVSLASLSSLESVFTDLWNRLA